MAELGGRHSLEAEEPAVEIGNVIKAHVVADRADMFI